MSVSSYENSMMSGVAFVRTVTFFSPILSINRSQYFTLWALQLQILREQQNLGWLYSRIMMSYFPIMTSVREQRNGVAVSEVSRLAFSISTINSQYSSSCVKVVAIGQANLQGKVDLTVVIPSQILKSRSLMRHLLTCSNCSGLLSNYGMLRWKPLQSQFCQLVNLLYYCAMRLMQGYSSLLRQLSFSVIFWKTIPLYFTYGSMLVVTFYNSSSTTFLMFFFTLFSISLRLPLIFYITQFTCSSLWFLRVNGEFLSTFMSPQIWWLMSQYAPMDFSRYSWRICLSLDLMMRIISVLMESNLKQFCSQSGCALFFSNPFIMLQSNKGIFCSTKSLTISEIWKLSCRNLTLSCSQDSFEPQSDSSNLAFLYSSARLSARWAILVYCPHLLDWQQRQCSNLHQHLMQKTRFSFRQTYQKSLQWFQSQGLYFLRLIGLQLIINWSHQKGWNFVMG